MSVFGSILGGLGSDALSGAGFFGASSALSNYMNSALSVDNQKDMMNYSNQLQRQWTIDQYGLMREGLEKAGMNPLMMSSVPSTQEALNSGSCFSGENSAKAVSEGKQQQAQERQIQANVKKSDYEIKSIQKDIDVKDKNIEYLENRISEIQSNIANNKNLTEAQIETMHTEANEMRERTQNIKKEREEMTERIDKLRFENSPLGRFATYGGSFLNGLLGNFTSAFGLRNQSSSIKSLDSYRKGSLDLLKRRFGVK